MQKTLIFLSKEQEQTYNEGGIASAVLTDGSAGKIIKVQKNNEGVACMVVSTCQAYTGVNPSPLFKGSDLNLTDSETLCAMKNGQVSCLRSSGAKEGDRVLTRKEQIEKGIARETIVIAEYVSGDKNKPTSYKWSMVASNSNKLEPIE